MTGWGKKPFDDAEMTMAKVFSKLWWRWRVWWWRVGFSYNWAALNTGGAGAALHMEHKTPTASTALHHHQHQFFRGFHPRIGDCFHKFTSQKTQHYTVHARGPQCLYNDRQTTHRGIDRLGGCHTYFTYVKIPWQADHTQTHTWTDGVGGVVEQHRNAKRWRVCSFAQM